MSLITGKGSEVQFTDNVDLSKVYIRLKANETVKVRVLGTDDYVEYKAHGSFSHKVYTQPCIAPNGVECPLCIASKSGVEGFDALYPRKRYVFAFGDIETGEIRAWDCSKNQAKELLSQIKEYEDDLGDIAFNFKRTGNGKETSYKLNPILKMKGDMVDKFHKFDEEEVPLSFFESVLVPRSEKLMKDVLYQAEFPMTDFFPDYVKPEDRAEGNTDTPEGTF